MPEFPGGNTALMSFIQQNIQYPDPDICITGKVIIQFIISTDGNITNAKIVRGVHPKFDKEALRVVKLMPKMEARYPKRKTSSHGIHNTCQFQISIVIFKV